MQISTACTTLVRAVPNPRGEQLFTDVFDGTAIGTFVEDAAEPSGVAHQLCQIEKMGIIGNLTIGIARDFNNLLNGFLLYCNLLLARTDLNEPFRRNLEQARGPESSSLGPEGAISPSHDLAILETASNPIARSPNSGEQP